MTNITYLDGSDYSDDGVRDIVLDRNQTIGQFHKVWYDTIQDSVRLAENIVLHKIHVYTIHGFNRFTVYAGVNEISKSVMVASSTRMKTVINMLNDFNIESREKF